MQFAGQGPVQIAYAVENVVAAAEAWTLRGAGPFFVREHIAVENSRMHGQPATFDHSSAYGQWGDVMVELICEHHLDADRVGPRSGVHHLAFFVDDFARAQAALVATGCREVLYAEAGSTEFAMHADPRLEHLVEIYVGSPSLNRFYSMVRDAAASTENIDSIRYL